MLFRSKKQDAHSSSGAAPSSPHQDASAKVKKTYSSPWAGVPVVLKQYDTSTPCTSINNASSTGGDRSKSLRSSRSLQSFKSQKSMASLRHCQSSLAGAPVVLKDNNDNKKKFAVILGKEPKTAPTVTSASPWAGVPVMLATDNERLQKEQQTKSSNNELGADFPQSVTVDSKGLFMRMSSHSVYA